MQASMLCIQYKIVVDGEWQHDEHQPFENGNYGTVNTVFLARESDYVPGILNPQMHSGSNMDVDNEAFQRLVRVSGGPLHEALPRLLLESGNSYGSSWDFCKGQFVGVLSALDFIMIVREAGPDENLKDVALKILQNNVVTVPVIHSSSGNASIPQLLHLASLSGILKCICRYFKHSFGILPMLQLPICAIPLGTWVSGIGETNQRPLAMLRPRSSLGLALSLLVQAHVSSIPIVDDNDSLLNVYSRSDINALAKDKIYTHINLEEMTINQYVPFGGPSGGDGGRGGNVYVEVDGSMNSLLPFRQNIHFRAGRGSHGQGKKQNGAKGEDVVVKVAPGTVIREAAMDGEQGEMLLELLYPGQRALLLPGGRGGRGNASFKSGTNKVVGVRAKVGAPNAGKSTLLSVISAAQPAIANYPFTTLLPNLGVVSFDYDSTMVVADLPGLLEGAHRGFGLGHEFLRHAERCSALVHVVDGSSQQPEYEFDAVRLELELFNPELAEKPYLVAYNKMDLLEASERWVSFKENLQARGIEPFCMSAVMREGTHEVICAAYELVRKRMEDNKEEGWNNPVNLNHVADMVQKQQTAPINEFEISHESSTNTWHVVGSGLQRFVQMTNWRYIDSERRFQHVLEACGVYKYLIKLGVKEGDTVVVGEMEMVWHDSADSSRLNLRKGSTGSIKWPQWT
ncbi:hypothetical protein ACSBR1_031870 [Camellia fascicularis]